MTKKSKYVSDCWRLWNMMCLYNVTLNLKFSSIFLIVVCWPTVNCKHIWTLQLNCFQLIFYFVAAFCLIGQEWVCKISMGGREISHKTDDPHNWCHCQQILFFSSPVEFACKTKISMGGREISHKTDDPHNWCLCQHDGLLLLLLLLHISLSCWLYWNSNSMCKRKSEM